MDRIAVEPEVRIEYAVEPAEARRAVTAVTFGSTRVLSVFVAMGILQAIFTVMFAGADASALLIAVLVGLGMHLLAAIGLRTAALRDLQTRLVSWQFTEERVALRTPLMEFSGSWATVAEVRAQGADWIVFTLVGRGFLIPRRALPADRAAGFVEWARGRIAAARAAQGLPPLRARRSTGRLVVLWLLLVVLFGAFFYLRSVSAPASTPADASAPR